MVKSLSPSCSNLFLHWTVAKIDLLENLPEMWKTVIFYQYCITNRSRNILNQKSNLVIELEFRKMIIRSEKDTSHSLQTVWNFGKIYKKNLQHTSSEISKKKKIWEKFMKNSLENVQIKGKSIFKLNFYRSVVMDSFTIELVSNASFNCYPNNSLSSFTSFLPEQLHLKGEWKVAFSEISYPSFYKKNLQRESLLS